MKQSKGRNRLVLLALQRALGCGGGTCPVPWFTSVSANIKKPSTVEMRQEVHGEGTVGRQGRRTANASKEFLLPTSRVSKYALVLGAV